MLQAGGVRVFLNAVFLMQQKEVPMQKATVFAILAPILYALGNVLLEHKFSKYNNLTLMIVYGTVITVSAIIVRVLIKNESFSYNFPVGNELWLLVALGFIFFAAAYFFIGAYTNGGKLLTITILMILLPVFASLFKFTSSFVIHGMVYTQPNHLQLSGYILAAIAVLLVVKGSS